MSKIAFLGLGAMGSRMVVHLINAGHAVTVWNRSAGAVQPIVELGAVAAATPRDAAEGAEFVLSMVTDDQASENIWTAPETGALAAIAVGAVAIEISTVSPEWLGKLAAKVTSRGVQFLDAPVSGSLPQAEAAKLAVFVGGDERTVAIAKPILTPFAGALHHVGPIGAGLNMKLAVNGLLAIQVAAIAETIGTLGRTGMAPKAAFDVLSTLATASPAANWIGGLMVSEDFAPRFPIDLMAKDLRYGADNAARLGSKAPALEAARSVFEGLQREGYGADNISAAIQAYR